MKKRKPEEYEYVPKNFDSFADKLTGFLESLEPTRKKRDVVEEEDPEDDRLYKELKLRRQARLQALRDKYKD